MGAPRNYVGRCIYCDSTENLTREHIIPEGIGGRWVPPGRHEALVLGKATCDKCREITLAFEGRVQGKMMGYYRASKGFGRKDRRSKTKRLRVDHPDGREEFRDFAPGELPAALVMPVFGEPGFFSGVPKGGPYNMRIFAHLDQSGVNPSAVPEGPKYNLAGLGPNDFARLIAKIGLGFAVYEYGLDSFKPLVRNLILGDQDEFGHWIGGPCNYPPEPPQSHLLHDLTLGEGDAKDGKTYLIAWVRLFAGIDGSPRNYAIVGELPKPASAAGDDPEDRPPG